MVDIEQEFRQFQPEEIEDDLEPRHREVMLDLILVTPEIKEVWQSKLTKPLENGSVSVVSREGLIKLKTLSFLIAK